MHLPLNFIEKSYTFVIAITKKHNFAFNLSCLRSLTSWPLFNKDWK